jgi:predicted permease
LRNPDYFPMMREVPRKTQGRIRLEHVWQDIRFAMRLLRRSPAHTIITLVTLGLGLGAATAMFTVVDGVLLRPLPYPQPERLVQISTHYEGGPDYHVIRAAQFRFLQQHSRSFDSFSLMDPAPSGVSLSGRGGPEQVATAFVSADFLRVLGLTPAIGRSFNEDENHPGAGCAAIITDGLFRRRFNSDVSAMRNETLVNGQGCTIVGVLPRGLSLPLDAEMMMPVRISAEPTDLGHYYQLVARLKAGVSVVQGRAELETLFSQFKAAHGDLVDDGEVGLETRSYQEAIVGNARTALCTLLGAVFLLLLIASVNVAHMQLSRGAVRTREMAVRAALGAGRSRLVRQLITESALMALAGGGCGLGLSFVGVPLLLHLAPSGIPRVNNISLNCAVVLFAFAMSAVSLLVAGVAPALTATRLDLNGALKTAQHHETAGSSRGWTRSLFIGTEVALSVIVLTGAILLIRSFIGLQQVNPGFNPSLVVAFKMPLPARYSNTAQTWAFESGLLKRLDALPGVDSAATATSLPMEAGPDMPGAVIGQPTAAEIDPAYRPVSPGYFHVLEIPLIRGRSFTDGDGANSTPVAIVNATLARKAFGSLDPIGEKLKLGAGLGAEYTDSTRVVVGVVGDVRETSLATMANPTVFIPRAQIPNTLTPLMNKVLPISCAVRSRIPPTALIDSIRRTIAAADPQQAIANVRTMVGALQATLGRQRFTLLLMTIFALLATTMASVGIYGVVSYQVRQRRRELGIRLALGAAPRSLVRLVALRGARPIAVGIIFGVGASLALGRFIRSLLYGTSPNDPVSMVVSVGALAFVAFLAVYLPARRASLTDPMEILRDE